jgi:hypothetical protein
VGEQRKGVAGAVEAREDGEENSEDLKADAGESELT